MARADHTDLKEDNGCASHALERALHAMLPADVAASAGRIGPGQAPLFDVERAATIRAVATRRAEFAAGRSYARNALRQLGCPDQPIPRATDRRPIWPVGYIGSIAHSRTLCGAIAASDRSYLGLGLDLEPAKPLDPDLFRLIGRPEERDAFPFPVASPAGPVDRGRLVFTIKEAVFKACYPVMRGWFDFLAARVEIDAPAQRFSARIVKAGAAPPGFTDLDGRWQVVCGHIVATLYLLRDSGTS